MRYGYIRVSRANDDGSTTLGNQRRQLAAADVDHLFEDVVSGLAASRPGLDELLDVVQAGDTVVVVALDRLGRDFMHSVGLLQTFADRGVDLQVMNLPTDVADVAGGGRLIAVIALELAAIEREKIAERTRARLDRARAEGKLTGAPLVCVPWADAPRPRAEGRRTDPCGDRPEAGHLRGRGRPRAEGRRSRSASRYHVQARHGVRRGRCRRVPQQGAAKRGRVRVCIPPARVQGSLRRPLGADFRGRHPEPSPSGVIPSLTSASTLSGCRIW